MEVLNLLALKATMFAQAIGTPCSPAKRGSFFGLPHWYEYVPNGQQDGLGNCIPKIEIPGGLVAVLLSLIDGLLIVAGFVAVIFVIIAGIVMLTSRGNPEKAASARTRLINAIVGLLIAITASAFVRFIGDRLGG